MSDPESSQDNWYAVVNKNGVMLAMFRYKDDAEFWTVEETDPEFCHVVDVPAPKECLL